MKAQLRSPNRLSLTGTTAQLSIEGYSISFCSISAAAIFSPARLICSLIRPSTITLPVLVNFTKSPIR